MAINIRFGTTYDGKGLNIAKRELANLSTSVNSLGRNFVVAGAAFAAIGVGLASTVKVASDLQESVNAVNVAFGSSAAGILKFGETAATSLGVSQVAFNNASVRFSAFANRIVGEGGNVAGFIADVSTRASDFASVFNIDVAEALGVFQSGLAGEAEPLKRFGVNLLDNEVKAYAAANSIGTLGQALTETEKVQARYGLLMQETAKTAGDFANTSDGLANGLRILQAQVTDTQAEIGTQLLPVLAGILPIVRDLVAEFGDKLVVAVKAVDWQGLLTTVMNLVTAFVENIEVITQTAVVLFTLNTVLKTATVMMNFAIVAGQFYALVQGQIAAGVTLATIATNLFSAAIRLIPFVAVLGGLAYLVVAMVQVGDQANKGKPYVDAYGGVIRKSGDDALWAAGKYGIATDAVNNYNAAVSGQKITTSAAYDAFEVRRARLMAEQSRAIFTPPPPVMPDFSSLLGGGGSSGAASINESLNQLIAAQQQAANQESGILDKRLSAFESFSDSVKSVFGQIKNSIMSSFDLPKLGNSVNSITRNIAKLLDKTKGFANSITQLAGLGLNSALLQQVIQAGPMAGSQLASAIVGGGSAFIGQLNAAYGEFGNLASGIASSGTKSAFGSQQVVNNYNIEVSGGVGSGPSIGKAIVDAIKSYERTSGAVWQGA
jgi:hypothetical protein